MSPVSQFAALVRLVAGDLLVRRRLPGASLLRPDRPSHNQNPWRFGCPLPFVSPVLWREIHSANPSHPAALAAT
jgi:hypothetical protein